MKTYPTKNIRNILLLGHGGCGKTTLTEALAFNAGAIDRMGRIDEGNTLSDFDAEEKRRMFSISSSVIPVEYGGHKIYITSGAGGSAFEMFIRFFARPEIVIFELKKE